MATTFGLNATLRDVNVPSSKIKSNEGGGRVQMAYDEVTFSSEPATNDVVNMMKLPKGAKIVDAAVVWAATGGSVGNIGLGWAASSDGVEAASAQGLIASVSTVAAGSSRTNDSGNAGAAGNMKTFASECQVQLLVVAGTTGGAFNGKKFKVMVQYVI